MEIIKTETETLKRTITTVEYNDEVYRYFELLDEKEKVIDSYIRDEHGHNIDDPSSYESIENAIVKQQEKEEEFYALKNEIIDCRKECKYIFYDGKIYDKKDVVIEKDDILIYSFAILHKGIVKTTLSMKNMTYHSKATDRVTFMRKLARELITFQF